VNDDVNIIMEYSDVKSETDVKSELAEAISISTVKPKIRASRQNIFIVKKEMNSPRDAFGPTL
jgi:hypothetical protein